MKTAIITKGALALAGVLLLSAPVSAGTCLRMRITANGAKIHFLQKPVMVRARASAAANWSRLAAIRAGAAYRRWENAGARKMHCGWLNRSYYRCVATATPCRR